MKKQISLLLCLVLVFSLAACGGNENAPAEEEKVETVTVTRIATEIRRNGADEAKLEYVYDEAAVCIEVISYMNGEEVLRTTPTCDEKGNILTKTYSLFGGTLTDTYTYDENGRTLTYAQTDANGNLIYGFVDVPHETAEFTSRTMTTVTPNGEMVQRLEYTFDDQGNAIRQDVYMNDSLAQYFVFTNDEQGRVIAQEGYAADGSAVGTTEYTYEDNTKLGVNKAPDGTVLNQAEILMDDEGRTLESKVTMNGSIVNHQSFTYQTIQVPVA